VQASVHLCGHPTDPQPLAALSPDVKLVSTPATMTVPELERLLHQETLQGLRRLMHEASGRQRRRLADDLRRQEDWVPHWHIYGDLNHQPWSYERKEGRRGHESGLLHRELSLCAADVVVHQARLHDFSRWIQGVFRDSALATTVEAIEDEAAARARAATRSAKNC